MDMKVSELCGKLYDLAKANPERRFYSLYDKVERMDVLKEAWESVMKNGGSPGIDGMTTGKLKKDGIEPLLTEIQAELKARTYTPSPLKRVYMPKANGKNRPLSIPTIKDRITQTAIKIIIEPIFETQFEPNSFGFRPNKSAHDAVDEIVKYLNYGCEHIIDADISQCFDNIDKHKLMEQVAKRISDGSLLHPIRQLIDAGIMEVSPSSRSRKTCVLSSCSHRPVIAFRQFGSLHAAKLKHSFASLTRYNSPPRSYLGVSTPQV